MRSVGGLAVFASFFIVAVAAIVVSVEYTGAAWITQEPGMYEYTTFPEQYSVAGAPSERPLPAFTTKDVDWNFAPIDVLFTAIAERSQISWKMGGLTQPQYDAMLKALATLRLGIEARCVGEQDVKVALRLLGGANRGAKFKEQYEKARDCLNKMVPPEVEKPLPPRPTYPVTLYEGSWVLLYGEGANNTLVVRGFNATANFTINGVSYGLFGPIEIVQGGFNYVVEPVELRIFESVEDPATVVYRGEMFIGGRVLPVVIRRVIV